MVSNNTYLSRKEFNKLLEQSEKEQPNTESKRALEKGRELLYKREKLND